MLLNFYSVFSPLCALPAKEAIMHGKTDGKYFWASWDDPKKLKNQKNLINAYHKQLLKSSSFNFSDFFNQDVPKNFVFGSSQLAKKYFRSVLPNVILRVFL